MNSWLLSRLFNTELRRDRWRAAQIAFVRPPTIADVAVVDLQPGEAKLELKERLGRSGPPSQSGVEIETANKPTDAQIVAKVKEHLPQRR